TFFGFGDALLEPVHRLLGFVPVKRHPVYDRSFLPRPRFFAHTHTSPLRFPCPRQHIPGLLFHRAFASWADRSQHEAFGWHLLDVRPIHQDSSYWFSRSTSPFCAVCRLLLSAVALAK